MTANEQLGWKQRYSTDLKMAHLDQLSSQFSRTASGLPLLRPDFADRPPSAEPFVDKRDRMHQFMLDAAANGRGVSSRIPTSTAGMNHMRTCATAGTYSDACYTLAPTQSLRKALLALPPDQRGLASAPPLVEPCNPPLPKRSYGQSQRCLSQTQSRMSNHFPLGSNYQLTHGSLWDLPTSDLGLTKHHHFHPRDTMTDYREDIKKSTGKVSFHLRSADEVSQYKGKSSFDFNVDRHINGSRKDPPNTLAGWTEAKNPNFKMMQGKPSGGGTWAAGS